MRTVLCPSIFWGLRLIARSPRCRRREKNLEPQKIDGRSIFGVIYAESNELYINKYFNAASVTDKHTEPENMACTWFSEICFCCCLACRNKFHQTTYKPYFRALYFLDQPNHYVTFHISRVLLWGWHWLFRSSRNTSYYRSSNIWGLPKLLPKQLPSVQLFYPCQCWAIWGLVLVQD